MHKTTRTLSAALFSTAALGVPAAFAGPPVAPLTPGEPLTVPGGAGSFDWMAVDGPMHRLYAAHKGTRTLIVLDLRTGKLLPAPVTGGVQGIAIDEKDDKLFLGDEDEQKVVVLNRETLQSIAEIKVTGPVDAVAFDPHNGKVYADHDDGTEAWVIDAKTDRLVGAVTLSGAPEFIEYDAKTDRLYQNIKTKNEVAVIDPATDKVVASWPTAPANGPHGLAVDSASGRLYSAGSGHVVAIDLASGKVVGSAEIAPGYVDQIAYDAQCHRLYCAVRGNISILEPTPDGIKAIANVPQPRGAHTIAIDPATGDVWICYADATASYLMKFVAAR